MLTMLTITVINIIIASLNIMNIRLDIVFRIQLLYFTKKHDIH
jgi:hypothetical protein